MLPKKLQNKIDSRKKNNALRSLKPQSVLIDFSSNDYLGFSKSESIFNKTSELLIGYNIKVNGATGSRLLSGNHKLYDVLEAQLCEFHKSDAAIVFNSGYDANIGFFSSVPQRGDVILYDELIHASIRDGIIMSNAKSFKFRHNDLVHLEAILNRIQHETVYIVTESVFSMDGDTPDLKNLIEISKKHKAHLVIDEAHAVGVFGDNGSGLVQDLELEDGVFARIITFGKALGCHGATILGSKDLKQYLINFCRSFIYTTALPPHSIATIKASYNELNTSENQLKLNENINLFKSEIKKYNLNTIFIESNSAIQCCVISGNDKVKDISNALQRQGFDVKPILSPTVPEGEERLRFCLHSYNSEEEISSVIKELSIIING
ncbi:MAG: aminotransferase class I/II-fold pyridoxal phosphate-dependent enzyme [Jejuia sp.]